MSGFTGLTLALLAMGSTVPSCHGRSECSMLDAQTVEYSSASCQGASASSCWTIVSVDLPENLSHGNVKARASSFHSWASSFERQAGLVVVHSEGDYEDYGRQSEEGEGQGLHYSVDTRIVEMADRPNVLQAQVLYGNGVNNMSKPTPGWHQEELAVVHAGGNRLELDIMCCAEASDFKLALGAGYTPCGHQEISHDPFEQPHREQSQPQVSNDGQDMRISDRRQPASPKLRKSSAEEEHSSAKRRSIPSDLDASPSSATDDWLDDDHFDDLESTDEHGKDLLAAMAIRKIINAFSAERNGHKTNGGEEEEPAQEIQRRSMQGEGEGESESCNSYQYGDEWCLNSITSAEAEALEVAGTSLYCSRECNAGGAIWCDIFGRKNCRMCSHDCAEYCKSRSEDCTCQQCPASGATEKRTCDVGDNGGCYYEIGDGDYIALAVESKMMECDHTCLEGEGLWCNAMGISGCRFCSLDCKAHCSRNTGGTGDEDEECHCVPCRPGLTVPPPPSSAAIDVETCADHDDGDSVCLNQVTKEGKEILVSKGMSIECHPRCLPGTVWPVWCYAEEMVGCRYCAQNCDELCGEGVGECAKCYQCGGRDGTP